MKIIVNQSNLIKNLTIAKVFSAGRSTLPVLSSYLLEAYDNTLTITSTNLETSVRIAMPAEVAEDGTACIPAELFLDWLKATDGSVVKIEDLGKQERVKVSCGKPTIKLPTYSNDDFPDIATIEQAKVVLETTFATIKRIDRLVSVATNPTDSRPMMCGLNFTMSADDLEIAGTDSNCIAVLNLPITCSISGALLLPVTAISKLASISAGDDVPLTMYVRQGDDDQYTTALFQLIGGDRDAFTQLEVGMLVINALYPKYQSYFQQNNFITEITANRAAWEHSVGLTMQVIKHTLGKRINLKLQNNVLYLHTYDQELGESHDDLSVEVVGQDTQEFILSSQYLLSALHAMETEQVRMGIMDYRKAMIIKPLDANGYKYQYLVMPMAIQPQPQPTNA
jgi:DNA polymerase III subunit beta